MGQTAQLQADGLNPKTGATLVGSELYLVLRRGVLFYI